MSDIFSIDNEYIAHTYGRFPVAFTDGKGARLVDTAGKEYIDLGSGIAVNIFGIADDEWQKAVTEQLGRLQHTSNLYYTEPCAKLAEHLCTRTGMKKVFYGNSGAEANECAIKAARLYSFNKYGEGRSTIVTLKNSFHGRTITTLAATGQDVFHTKFGPFTEGFVYCEADNIEELRKFTAENNCCGIMFEVVQGEGGIHVLSKEFVAEIDRIAKEKDLVVIVDEVQTGNGRTGELYCFMNFGVKPDIVSTAKGLGNGLPLGATMLSEKVKDVLGFSSHGSTFGGNPICCAGAISILSRITDELLDEVNEKSEYIISRLSQCKNVKSVSGKGLMLGIECEKPAKEIIAAAMEKGVLVLSAKTKVRLLPPLNIPFELLEDAIDKLIEAIEE